MDALALPRAGSLQMAMHVDGAHRLATWTGGKEQAEIARTHVALVMCAHMPLRREQVLMVEAMRGGAHVTALTDLADARDAEPWRAMMGATGRTLTYTTYNGSTTIMRAADARRHLVATIEPIYAYYDARYAPPHWVGANYADEFETYANRAFLFVDAGADVAVCRRLACEREPVNIAMRRRFDEAAMERHFGYATSFYTRHYEEHGRLAPNIGVLTFCAVRVGGSEENVHVYHAIGAALDSAAQPDYSMVARGREVLVAFYARVFSKVFAAARHCGAKGIVMSLVGAASFAEMYPGGKHQMHRDVWVPAFDQVRSSNNNAAVKLAAMGRDADLANPAGECLRAHGASAAGNYPQNIFSFPGWMFVNAWDCHSMPGNGNEMDGSLEGYVGRSSAVHYFGWGTANPHLVSDEGLVVV